MRVITFFKTIDLDNYNTINYDYDRLMVSFEAHSESEVFYFENRRLAEEFLDEIYEALESGFDEVNLRAHPLYYKTVNLKGLKEYIKKFDQR
mgnify:FL=1